MNLAEHGVNKQGRQKLLEAGFDTVKSVLEANPRRIEYVLGKPAPAGNTVLNALLMAPRLSIEVTGVSPDAFGARTQSIRVSLQVRVSIDKVVESKSEGWDTGVLLLVGIQNGPLCHCERFAYGPRDSKIELKIALPSSDSEIKCSLISEEFIGIDTEISVPLEAVLPPRHFAVAAAVPSSRLAKAATHGSIMGGGSQSQGSKKKRQQPSQRATEAT